MVLTVIYFGIFLVNPRREDIRIAQIQVLLAEIDRLAYNSATNERKNNTFN